MVMLLAMAPMSLFAQSALTIFSEDGYKFYLVLNGQRQNTIPMTNIHIDGLMQPNYAVKIIFEDATKPELSKNIPVVDPGTSAPADVTYKIKTQKDGDMKIRFFSATPVPPNYVAPPDMYVMHYGQPVPPPPPPVQGGTTVTQTTVTQTSGGSMQGGNMSMNVGGMGANVNVGVGGAGVNMNININDDMMGGSASTTSHTVTRTTTTTTTSGDMGYGNNGGYNTPPPAPPARGSGCGYAMDGGSFRSAKETINKASFEDTKLSTAKSILSSNCMTSDQIMQVCNTFSFEASKLEFAKYAYDRCTDKGNYFKVGNVFSFDASRTELNEHISGN
ncbi:hypothetical protein GCM10023093_14290 [Nemorincola caseinilytica]|uniref:DUF4476 domain-containing protein n=1 Tax=Nemorincola caseinilytica TaxID=2054315 RepID=A0ABP8NB33_9BACT